VPTAFGRQLQYMFEHHQLMRLGFPNENLSIVGRGKLTGHSSKTY